MQVSIRASNIQIKDKEKHKKEVDKKKVIVTEKMN